MSNKKHEVNFYMHPACMDQVQTELANMQAELDANSVRVRSMKKIILFLTSFFAVGCSKEAISIVQSNNPNFKVEFLFEQDSCKVYRFYDEGRAHYFTNCTETISTQTYQCGKTQCKRLENVRSK